MSENKTKELLIHGDCLDVLKTLEDNSVDSVVTDPPYGLSKEPDINEVLTKWLAGEEYDHGHGGFMGKCFHPNTDILTLRGWVSVKDVSKNDVVYTLNKDTNEIELSDVTNTFEYDFKGELISIAGRSVSQLVTPNHKVLVGNRKKEYKLQRADGRFNHRFYMKNQGDWTVSSTETISFAGSERNAGDLAYFIGIYLGDGYFVDRKSHKEKQNFAGFSVKKERKAQSIRGALSSLGFEFTENPPNESNEHYRFYLYDKDLLHELRDFGRSYDKHIPDYFFGESKEILRELYRGLIETDGTVQGNKNQEVFYTTSPRLADDFQRLCFLIGKSATKSIVKKSKLRHKDTFVLSVINEGKDFYLEKDKNISRIPYDGKVYCIEAERNHILMTRFDGKPVWSGNSWDSFVPHPDIWREVYRVLKPGGHALVFAGTRTQDLMTISLRLAGFEVRDVIEWLYFCLSDDTQALTREGWKSYKELSKDDYVMQWDSETGELSWVKPEAIHVFPYNGKMLNFKSRATDQLVTPNHRMYVDVKKHSRNEYAGKYEVYEAKGLKRHWHKRFPLAGTYKGDKSIGINRAKLLGWFLTDAWVHGDGKAVMFSQSKPETLVKLREVLDEADVTYSEYTKEPKKDTHNVEHTFYVTGKDADWLLENYGDRRFNNDLLDLIIDERKALLESLIDGDGSRSEEGLITFWSKDEDFRNFVRQLMFTMNMRTSVDNKKGCVRGSTRFNATELQHKHGIHEVDYEGDVWCVTVPKGAFVVKRNDYVFITGNSGFPKSHDVSKAFDRRAGAERKVVGKSAHSANRASGSATFGQIPANEGERLITAPATELARKWDGWGTALKPAHEPIIVVRKPLIDADTGRKLTVADCVEKYGTGAINIDASRIATEDDLNGGAYAKNSVKDISKATSYGLGVTGEDFEQPEGRFPANCITLDGDAFYSKYFNISPPELSKKASKKDRNSDWQGEEIDLITLQEMPFASESGSGKMFANNKDIPKQYAKGNNHPTVKPTDLMAWLVRLVTPKGGTVLDPFAGSGSTLVAAKREGFGFIGVELTEEYIPIIEARTGVEHIKAETSERQAIE